MVKIVVNGFTGYFKNFNLLFMFRPMFCPCIVPAARDKDDFMMIIFWFNKYFLRVHINYE
jgi:hypothetical protein